MLELDNGINGFVMNQSAASAKVAALATSLIEVKCTEWRVLKARDLKVGLKNEGDLIGSMIQWAIRAEKI